MGLVEKVECAACVQKTDLFVGLCYLAKEKAMREVRKRHVNKKFAPLSSFFSVKSVKMKSLHFVSIPKMPTASLREYADMHTRCPPPHAGNHLVGSWPTYVRGFPTHTQILRSLRVILLRVVSILCGRVQSCCESR